MHVIILAGIVACVLSFAVTAAFSQQDSVEFKLIPKYCPEEGSDFISLPPPEVAHKPTIVYPRDRNLPTREAVVHVGVFVNRKGVVRDEHIVKSTDEAFNKYAIDYAKKYRFKWSEAWPDELKNRKGVWISIPIYFRH